MYSGLFLGLLAFVAIIPMHETALGNYCFNGVSDDRCTVGTEVCCKSSPNLVDRDYGICTLPNMCCGSVNNAAISGTCDEPDKNTCCALSGECLPKERTCGISTTSCSSVVDCLFLRATDTCCKTSNSAYRSPGVCTAESLCCGQVNGFRPVEGEPRRRESYQEEENDMCSDNTYTCNKTYGICFKDPQSQTGSNSNCGIEFDGKKYCCPLYIATFISVLGIGEDNLIKLAIALFLFCDADPTP